MPRLRLGVALLVPRPLSGEVDVLRRACGEEVVARLAPHITLVPPVNVWEDRLGDALAVMRTAAAATRPITVALGPPGTFLPVNPVLYLAVGGDVEAVRALRDRVFTEPLARDLTWPFHPHVTVRDGGEPERLHAAVAALAGYRAEVTFERVHLLQEGRDETGARVWRPIADAALAAPAVVGRGGLELELAVSEQLDPEADAFREREWAVVDPDPVATPDPATWPWSLVEGARWWAQHEAGPAVRAPTSATSSSPLPTGARASGRIWSPPFSTVGLGGGGPLRGIRPSPRLPGTPPRLGSLTHQSRATDRGRAGAPGRPAPATTAAAFRGLRSGHPDPRW